MSTLKQITTKAKVLYKTGKYKKWTDAIKAASKVVKGSKKIGAFKIVEKGQSKNLKAKIFVQKRNAAGQFKGLKRIGELYKYFNVSTVSNLDDLKKQYYKAAKQYHPDAGGTNEAFKNLQKEYEYLFKKLLNGTSLNSDEIKNEIDIDENLRNSVNAIIGLNGITVELVGKWLWIGGNTYPIRNELKQAGFQFAPVKKMWYYKGVESAGRGNLTMDEIRGKYGSEFIKNEMKQIKGIGENLSLAKRKKFYNSIKKVMKGLNKRKQSISVSGIAKKVF